MAWAVLVSGIALLFPEKFINIATFLGWMALGAICFGMLVPVIFF